MTDAMVTLEDINAYHIRLKKDADSAGYYLNPDVHFTQELVKGLIINERRYGYPSCPCRLATGVKEKDMDIICPCDYRDADISEFGSCYCALYVSQAIAKGEKEARPIPERRHLANQKTQVPPSIVVAAMPTKLSYPVWRCRVCGYLCARTEPPDICPICKVKKERFERFI